MGIPLRELLDDPIPSLPLFVYGTLRTDCCSESLLRLRGEMTSLGYATMPGNLFDLGDYPGFVPADDGGVVRGELLIDESFTAADTLERLDRYECCDAKDPALGLYRRERAVATLESDGTSIDCWVYVYARKLANARQIECGCWRAFRNGRE